MKKFRVKHVNINSIWANQIQNVMTFDVDTSQWMQSVTTFDTKIKLFVCTMK